jgi:hypothetical protein
MSKKKNKANKIGNLEPNMFAISIHDSFCEHTYKLKLTDDLSIHRIMKKICKKFKVKMPESELRWVKKY